jgi:hypothetical protein
VTCSTGSKTKLIISHTKKYDYIKIDAKVRQKTKEESYLSRTPVTRAYASRHKGANALYI